MDISNQILDFFYNIVGTDSWPARWYCGEWSDFHGWLYIISDLIIWLSYFAIPILLFAFLLKARISEVFPNILKLFIAFILACGLTHLIDAVIFWWPAYRLSALIRFITAVVSLITVFKLAKALPVLLSMKSAEQLEKEADKRKEAEKQLAKKVAELELINKLIVNRELKMKELKEEIRILKSKE